MEASLIACMWSCNHCRVHAGMEGNYHWLLIFVPLYVLKLLYRLVFFWTAFELSVHSFPTSGDDLNWGRRKVETEHSFMQRKGLWDHTWACVESSSAVVRRRTSSSKNGRLAAFIKTIDAHIHVLVSFRYRNYMFTICATSNNDSRVTSGSSWWHHKVFLVNFSQTVLPKNERH